MGRLQRAWVIGLAAMLMVLGGLAGPALAQQKQQEFGVDTIAVITGGGSGLRVTGTYSCPGDERAQLVLYAGLTRTSANLPCTDGYPASWRLIVSPPDGTWRPGQIGFYAAFTTPAGEQVQETGTLTIV